LRLLRAPLELSDFVRVCGIFRSRAWKVDPRTDHTNG